MNKTVFVLILSSLMMPLSAQTVVKRMTLQEAIEMAKEQSVKAMEAKNNLQIAHWQYRNFRADLLPNMSLSGTLPSLNKSYNRYQDADGSYRFVSSSSLSENLALSLTQNIPLTGGTISFQSEIDRIDQLGESNTTNYLTMPVMFTLSQPLFAYNRLKWAKRIEPIKNIESQKRYVADMEAVCLQTVNHYFNLLISMINSNIAEQNRKNATQLYQIAENKKRLGLISENDLQQLHFAYINASTSIIEAEQNYERNMYQLRTFLGYNETVEIVPEIPENTPHLALRYDEVLEVVKTNNPFFENVKRRTIDSDRQIAQARSQKGPKLDIYTSFGYSGNNNTFPSSYDNLQDRAVVSLGVRVPILDWGRGKGQVVIAEYQKEVESGRITQDVQNFEQDIKILVNQIQSQPQLVKMYKLADSIAQNRYKIAYETFVMGQINVLDINTAQIEEDNAKRNYINQLYYSWLYHFQLRGISLYDFASKQEIINHITETAWTEKYLNNLFNND